MGVRPQLQALMLADHIYVDAATGKKIIAGAFNRLSSKEFPSTAGVSKYTLISLTDVHGTVSLILRFVDLSTGDTLLEMQGLEVHADNPLDTVEMILEIPPLPLPHPGTYALEVYSDNEMIGVLRVFADAQAENESEANQ